MYKMKVRFSAIPIMIPNSRVIVKHAINVVKNGRISSPKTIRFLTFTLHSEMG